MKNAPPKSARFLLKLLCDPHFHEEVEGDLDELFDHNLSSFGLKTARRRYWGDVFKHFNWYFITKRNSSNSSQNIFDMWTSYMKIALRNMLKSKRYTTMNVMGLGVGMACAMLILIYALHEVSYDKFHEKAERTYIIHTTFGGGGETIGSAPNIMMPTLLSEIPDIETGVRIFNRGAYRPYTIKYKENVFQEDRLFHVDSTFFDVFSFELLKGDKKNSLIAPRSIVLTEEMAVKYFGNEDPMGKTLRIGTRSDYQVTGVLKSLPSNSHMHFDFLVPYHTLGLQNRWGNASYTSYFVLNENATIDQFKTKLPAVLKKAYGDLEQSEVFTFLPLLDIHLNGLGAGFGLEPQSEMRYLYIFGFIGILILTIASINYTNLATARAVFRAKEIGMRKVLGAYRFNLLHQFMGESLMIIFVAVLMAFLLAFLALPSFNALADQHFVIRDLLPAEAFREVR